MKCAKRCPPATADALSTPGGGGGASATLMDLISSVNTLIDNLSSPDASTGPLAEVVVDPAAEEKKGDAAADRRSHSTADINRQLARLERLFAQSKRGRRQKRPGARQDGGGRRCYPQQVPQAKSKQHRGKKRRDACGGCSRSPCSNCTTSNCNALSSSWGVRGSGRGGGGCGGTDSSSAELSRSRMCCATNSKRTTQAQTAQNPPQLSELRAAAAARPLRHSLPPALQPQTPPQPPQLPRAAALQQVSSSSNSRRPRNLPAAAAAPSMPPVVESSLSLGDNASNRRQYVVRRGRRGAAEEAAAAAAAAAAADRGKDQTGGVGSTPWLGERMDFGYLKCGLDDGGLGQSGDQSCGDNLAKLEYAVTGMQEQVQQLNRTFEQQQQQSTAAADPCDPAPKRLQAEVRRAQARIAWLRGFLRSPQAGVGACGCRHRGAATELARDPLADLKCRYERSLLYSCFDVSWPFLHIIAPRPPTFDDPVCCSEEF